MGYHYQFEVALNRSNTALQKIEERHFKRLASGREPPRKMRDLLDEYIAANKLDSKYDPLDLIEDLKRDEDRERKMPDS